LGAVVTYADLVLGASINQLAELFGMDRRTVTDRLRGLDPSGTRASHPVYKIADAAPLLLEVTAGTRRAAEREKDYWDAQLKKQRFEENAGDLWRTDKVISIFAQVFKQFRESTVVFIDALEHESGLPPEVIGKAKQFGDTLLSDCRQKLLVMDTQEDEDLADLGLE
jgi:hypothetical protein